MPEGDVIWRAAERIRERFGGDIIAFAASSVSPSFQRLEGAVIEEVEPRGKHLLIHTRRLIQTSNEAGDKGLTVHTHLGMTGRWTVGPTPSKLPSTPGFGRAPTPRPKWLILRSDNAVAVCSGAPLVEFIPRRELAIHPVLRQLGSDVLRPEEHDRDAILAYAKSAATHPRLTVGQLLLDQRLVAGIGNIYRCEALFLAGIDPYRPAADLNDEEMLELVSVASRTMASALHSRPSHYVYRRAGRPCRRCGTRIEKAALGEPGRSRTIYWCPRCQR